MSTQIKNKLTLILGGARSGKSHFAQELAKQQKEKVLFVATAEPLDDEMRIRIEEHKKSRPAWWKTLESSQNIGQKIKVNAADAQIVIVDCITLLISNLVCREPDYREAEKHVLHEIDGLLDCIRNVEAHFIIVSNEVGLGLVPDNELGRVYRDMLGKSNQLLASHASTIFFMIAGIPSRISPEKGTTSI